MCSVSCPFEVNCYLLYKRHNRQLIKTNVHETPCMCSKRTAVLTVPFTQRYCVTINKMKPCPTPLDYYHSKYVEDTISAKQGVVMEIGVPPIRFHVTSISRSDWNVTFTSTWPRSGAWLYGRYTKISTCALWQKATTPKFFKLVCLRNKGLRRPSLRFASKRYFLT